MSTLFTKKLKKISRIDNTPTRDIIVEKRKDTLNMYTFTFDLKRTSKHTRKSGNEIISANDRLHFAVKAQLTKHLRELACALANACTRHEPFSPSNPCTVTIIVYAPTKRRMDPPNLYPTVKALIDGFTDAELWTDDNYEIIKAMTFIYGGLSGTDKYTLEIAIEKA